MAGRVHAIYIADCTKAPVLVAEVRLLLEKGLEGDRYAMGLGSFSRWPGTGREVTLINQEVIDAVKRDFALDLSEGKHRRNIVIEGLDVRELIHHRFRIGEAILRGDRPADPCGHLSKLLGVDVMEPLKLRGGTRASITTEAVIRVGDIVEIIR
jgi:MOSC domain-containing protein YiiM